VPLDRGYQGAPGTWGPLGAPGTWGSDRRNRTPEPEPSDLTATKPCNLEPVPKEKTQFDLPNIVPFLENSVYDPCKFNGLVFS